MLRRIAVFLVLCAIAAQANAARSSASYSVDIEGIGTSGGIGASAAYSNDSGVGDLSGTAAASSETADSGYVGQIDYFTALSVGAVSGTVAAGATVQLSATATTDDSMTAYFFGPPVTWTGFGQGIISVSANGLASTEAVYANTPTYVTASLEGLSATDSFTILGAGDVPGTYNATGALAAATLDIAGLEPGQTYNNNGYGITVSGTTIIGDTGQGTLNQTGGIFSTNTLTLGNQAGSAGTYNFSSGALSVANFNVGGGGVGSFTMSGGFASIGSLSVTQTNSVVLIEGTSQPGPVVNFNELYVGPGATFESILANSGTESITVTNCIFDTGSTLAVTLGGDATPGRLPAPNLDYTQIVANGTVSLSGNLGLSGTLYANPFQNVADDVTPYVAGGANEGFDNLYIIANNGGQSVIGGFGNADLSSTNGLEGAAPTVALGGQLYAVSYNGDHATNSVAGGNDVVLTPIRAPGKPLAVPVADYSFESPRVADGALAPLATTAVWSGTSNFGPFAGGVHNPVDADYPDATGDTTPLPGTAAGFQCATLSVLAANHATQESIVSPALVTAQNNMTYTATVALGWRLDEPAPQTIVLRLVSGSTILSSTSISGASLTQGTFTDWAVSYKVAATGDPALGEPVSAEVLLQRPEAGDTQVDIDNVRLVAEANASDPVFAFSSPSYTVAGGDTVLTGTITKNRSIGGDVVFSEEPGSAQPVSNGVGDYVATTGTLHFNVTDTAESFSIPINQDLAATSNRTFTIVLSSTTTGAQVPAAGAPVTIIESNTTPPAGPQMTAPNAAPEASGSLTIILNSTQPGAGWRLSGETIWRASGSSATGLTAGNYTVEFEPIDGYAPDPELLPVSGTGDSMETVDYPPQSTPQTGTLIVNITPGNIGGQWALLGSTSYNDTGVPVAVPVGVNIVQFSSVSGYTTPSSLSVIVTAGQTSTLGATYLEASPAFGLTPAVVSATAAQAEAPFCYNGQIQTDDGLASGFVTTEHVVMTAAHVVFDDYTMSDVTGLQWKAERAAGVYEPQPLVAAGWYRFSDYAAARVGAEPEVSNAASQQQDVAAVYFLTPACRYGAGGYLETDGTDQWLLNTGAGSHGARLKFMVGYPVDSSAISGTEQGMMFVTPPAPPGPIAANFQQLYTVIYGGTSNVYSTTDIQSYSGNSGGPLYVQYDDGNYYPAGIYLGGEGQTLVRAIDAGAVELMTSAEVSGNGGPNNGNSGVIASGNGLSTGVSELGFLQVTFNLPGGGWSIGNGTIYNTENEVSVAAGNETVSFADVAGHITPPAQSIYVTPGAVTPVTGTYKPAVDISAEIVPAGSGTVSGAGEVAQNSQVTLVAHPGPGNGFVDWTDTTGKIVYSNSPHLVLTASSSIVVRANFAPGPFKSLGGVYEGLVYDGAESGVGPVTGFASLTLKADGTFGAFTGSVRVGGVLQSFKGLFAPAASGTSATAANVPLGSKAKVTLTMDLVDGLNTITAIISSASGSEVFTIERNQYDGKTFKAPEAGYYTMLLPPDPAASGSGTPVASGYGTVSVNTLGQVRLAGALGDGTKLTQSVVVLGSDGAWPIYARPYAAGGGVAGLLYFSGTNPVIVSGSLEWVRPAARTGPYAGGFNGVIDAEGAQYEAPVALAGGTASFEGAVLASGSLADTVALTTTRTTISETTPTLSLTLTLRTGVITGRFLPLTAKKPLTFSGLYVPALGLGEGFFNGAGGETGLFELEPTP